MNTYVEVPAEPTPSMVAAGVQGLTMVGHHPGRHYTDEEKVWEVWRRMIEAAVGS